MIADCNDSRGDTLGNEPFERFKVRRNHASFKAREPLVTPIFDDGLCDESRLDVMGCIHDGHVLSRYDGGQLNSRGPAWMRHLNEVDAIRSNDFKDLEHIIGYKIPKGTEIAPEELEVLIRIYRCERAVLCIDVLIRLQDDNGMTALSQLLYEVVVPALPAREGPEQARVHNNIKDVHVGSSPSVSRDSPQMISGRAPQPSYFRKPDLSGRRGVPLSPMIIVGWTACRRSVCSVCHISFSASSAERESTSALKRVQARMGGSLLIIRRRESSVRSGCVEIDLCAAVGINGASSTHEVSGVYFDGTAGDRVRVEHKFAVLYVGRS